MYNKAAKKIASILILLAEKGDIGNICKDIQVISYGIELVLSSIVNLLLVLVCGEYFFGIGKTILFILFFCSIRQFSGGFHANSYVGCTVGFLFLFLAIGSGISRIENAVCFLVLCFLCICFIWIVAPVDTENKRLSKRQRDNCKKKIRCILVFEGIAIVVFFRFLRINLLQAAALALLIESLLLAMGKMENHRMMRKEEG